MRSVVEAVAVRATRGSGAEPLKGRVAVGVTGVALAIAAFGARHKRRGEAQSAASSKDERPTSPNSCQVGNVNAEPGASQGPQPVQSAVAIGVAVSLAIVLLGAILWLFSATSSSAYHIVLLFAVAGCCLAGSWLVGGRVEGGRTLSAFMREIASALLAGVAVAIVILPTQRQSSAEAQQRADRNELQFALADSELAGIDLSGRELIQLILFQRNLEDARFMQSSLVGVTFDQGSVARARFEGGDLSNVAFVSTVASEISFGCWPPAAHGTCLSPASLREVSFRGQTDLRKAQFHHADLNDTAFVQVDARGARFQGATITGGEFREVDLRGASFAGATLSSSTRLTDLCWDDTTLWPRGFDAPESEVRFCR